MFLKCPKDEKCLFITTASGMQVVNVVLLSVVRVWSSYLPSLILKNRDRSKVQYLLFHKRFSAPPDKPHKFIFQLCSHWPGKANPCSKSSAPWKHSLLELWPPCGGEYRFIPGPAPVWCSLESFWHSRTWHSSGPFWEILLPDAWDHLLSGGHH